jgi:hypothetical protein
MGLDPIAADEATSQFAEVSTPHCFASRRALAVFTLFVSGAVVSSCAGSAAPRAPTPAASFLSASEVQEGWRSMLSLDQWRGYRTDTLPSGWSANDSMLTKQGVSDDIVTRRTYADFELAFDWKLDEGGNSGVFYRATEEYEKIYWSAPEYALLDDAHHGDGRNPITSAGAAHSLHAAPRGVVKPAEAWNSARILVRGTHVEHWLNGQQVATYEFGSDDFRQRVAGSKFGRWPNFAKATRGVIGIQGDHRGLLSIRHLRIREFRE